MIRYGSVCSGIEAATMAWHPLGWEPAFFSEIEKFPCAALAHHYPHVPNLGDMTKFQEWPDHAIDLLVGGTPCQSFSVAGLRAGLADPRGNLMLTYLAIAARYQPRWLVWENVPGVLSSNGGRDFGTFLGGLGELGYGFAYRVLDAQFCRAHGHDRAVPQRRRRVFVVGYLGDWRRAAAVLFDADSLRGNPSPRREKGQGVAVSPTLRAGGNRTGGDRPPGTDVDTADSLIPEPIVMMERGRDGAPSLETRQDGTANAILTPNGGRGGLGVGAIAFAQNQRDEVREMDVAGALAAEPGMKQQTYLAQPIPIDMRQASRGATMTNNRAEGSSGGAPGTGIGESGDPAPTIASSHTPAVAWSIMPQNSGKDYKARAVDVAQPVMAGGPVGGNQGGDYIQEEWAVRRLTPRECERLQGFPDDFTAIPYRGKPAADGPRYKALGNSMAVNVMRVIGTRIAMVDALQSQEAAA